MKTVKKLTLVLLCLIFTYVNGQGLTTKVSLKYQNVSIEEILKDLSKKYNINFSYSSSTISLKKKVTISSQQITLSSALNEMFKGTEISYEEVGSSIVLKKTKKVETRINKSNSEFQSKESIKDTVALATITPDDSSDKIVTPEQEIILSPGISLSQQVKMGDTVTRENLRKQYELAKRKLEQDYFKKLDSLDQAKDEPNKNKLKTQFHKLIRDMKRDLNQLKDSIDESARRRREKLHQARDSSSTQDSVEAATRVGQVTFIPPISSDGARTIDNNYKMSFNILAGVTQGTRGFEGAGLVNVDKKDMHGFQGAGLVNVVGNEVKGGQFSGLTNVAAGDIKGVQAAGLMNVATSDVKGAQLAGFMNVASDTIHGAQLAGFLNVGKVVKGSQLGFINVADTVTGAQIGFISFSKRGYRRLELWGTETLYGNIAFKTGSKHFYNIFAAGAQTAAKSTIRWGFGYGIGTELSFTKRIIMNWEALCFNIHQDGFQWNELNLLNQLKTNLGVVVFKNISIFAGPTINVMVSNHYNTDTQTYGSPITPSHTIYNHTSGKTNVSIWAGFNVGIRF